MTHWGYALLIIFVGLGISRAGWRKAGRVAAMLAVAIMAYAFYSYGAI
jgi:hypothetical protein